MAQPRTKLSFPTEIFSSTSYAREVAYRITKSLPSFGDVVITGGTTAAKVYDALEEVARWDGLGVYFSDERCVPPEHPESNYKMATELFLNRTTADVHRMLGELEARDAADRYHAEIARAVARGPSLMFLGMGADCHIGALYPESPALDSDIFAAGVDRPDGMKGITLTPPAMLSAKSIRVLATGGGKAEAVKRVVRGTESPRTCPARLLADHPDVTFYLDEPAATLLG